MHRCPSCQRDKRPRLVRGVCEACYQRLRHQPDFVRLVDEHTKLSDRQHEILQGSMLGDGCLYQHTERHKPYLAVHRVAADGDYLRWEAAEFAAMLRPRGVFTRSGYDRRTRKTYHKIGFNTRSLSVFEPYRAAWYPDGVKRIPEDLELTPLVLAVWFADDGTICGASPKRPWSFQLKLATHCFTRDENERLAEMLRDRYDRRFRITRDGSNYFIAASHNAAAALAEEIDSVFPPGIERKAYWRRPEARRPIRTYEQRRKLFMAEETWSLLSRCAADRNISRAAALKEASRLVDVVPAPTSDDTRAGEGRRGTDVPLSVIAAIDSWAPGARRRDAVHALVQALAERNPSPRNGEARVQNWQQRFEGMSCEEREAAIETLRQEVLDAYLTFGTFAEAANRTGIAYRRARAWVQAAGLG